MKNNKIDLRQILLDAAMGDDAALDFLQYEVPHLKKRPEGCEEALIEASMREEVDCPDSYYWPCAETLVKINSSWDGLDDLLCKALGYGMMFTYGEYLFRFGNNRHWRLSARLQANILKEFRQKSWLTRQIYRIDGHWREVLRHCTADS